MSVRGDSHPLWVDLARQPGSGPPVWNFTKYLVGSDGRLLAHWPTKVTPEDPQDHRGARSSAPRRLTAAPPVPPASFQTSVGGCDRSLDSAERPRV
jgi:hypothetical protein